MVYVTNVIATEYIDFCNEYIPFLMNAKSITLRVFGIPQGDGGMPNQLRQDEL